VPDHKIYYGPSNPRPGDLLFDFAKLDKVIVTAKASEKMDLIFYLMGDCVAGSNNVNYAAVTNDYVDDMPASEDYVTYEIDFSDKVASVLASNQTYKYVRQIAIQHGFGEMYISDIKFVPAGYKAQSSLLTAGFEMVKDFGKATESNISNADMPCEVSDISATLNACVNHSNKPVSISLVSALYDGDKLIKVVSNTQRLASGEKITEPMVATIEDVPVGANYIVKGFLWNNFEPIATNYTLYHTK